MIKLNEAASTSNISDSKKDEKHANEEPKEENVDFNSLSTSSNASDKPVSKPCDIKKDVPRFTMLFNKFSSDTSKSSGNEEDKQKRDVQCVMFFNKDVTISSGSKSKKNSNSLMKINHNQSKLSSRKSDFELGKPQISETMFTQPLTPTTSTSSGKPVAKLENLQKFISRKNSKTETDSLVQLNVHPAMRTDLRVISSLTSLNKNPKLGVRNNLKSKIPSLTAIETKSFSHKNDFLRNSNWDDWEELMLMQNDLEKRLNLQISRSSNDHNHRCAVRFKKEDGSSVSDSKLLYADLKSKKQIKKCDNKSRGDSSRKERESGSRKQVQWKTEVDVIYFSTHLAANGDRMREVIGRVMEPLREEWEQQRNGFYAKMVPYQMESHLKDRFISLLKI